MGKEKLKQEECGKRKALIGRMWEQKIFNRKNMAKEKL